MNIPASISALAASIVPVDESLSVAAQAHLDNLTKPVGSLGRLEELASRLYCIQGGKKPLAAYPARVYTMAADHGVVAEGVSPYPQEVTRQMMLNFLNNGAGINVLCETAGIEQYAVDVACLGPDFDEHPRLVRAKIAQGSANLAKGPAMSFEQCEQAVQLGVRLAEQAAREGCRSVATGEMGIGNTTPSTALFCAYLGLKPGDLTGPGTGLDQQGIEKKAAVINTALKVNKAAIDSADGFTILAALGGFEIAALAGLILGGAKNGLAVMVDGFISTAAYLAAVRIAPAVEGYCIFSHGSAERAHKELLGHMGKKPLLDLGLRLGEGTGAALALFLLHCGAQIFNTMATFEGANVSR